jgi:hypothetical protein
MKKLVPITKTVTHCDICGKEVENDAMAPFVLVKYLTTYDYGKTRVDDTEDIGCQFDLCAYHSTILGSIARRKVKDALTFFHNEQELKSEIEKNVKEE